MRKRVLAVSALVTDAADRILLIQRGHEPAKGLWSVPGGSVEEGVFGNGQQSWQGQGVGLARRVLTSIQAQGPRMNPARNSRR